MRLVFHGGKCCGIKTIYEFPSPYNKVEAVEKTKLTDADQMYHATKSDQSFFSDAAPEETAVERLDRFIAFCRRRRPQHLIEIALAQGAYIKQLDWVPYLEARGFRLVSRFKNSNSGNTVYVYHLTYDVRAERAAEKKAKAEEVAA